MKVEDSYTQEALASEERENEIRHQLEHIQQQLLTSSHSLQDSKYVTTLSFETNEAFVLVLYSILMILMCTVLM